MNKSDAKVIVDEVYDAIIARIDNTPDPINESELIDFLHEIAQKLFAGSFRVPLNLYTPKLSFDSEYQYIAKEGLASYQSTNDIMATLTERQREILSESFEQKLIDEASISERFREIQDHMNKEISKANQTITDLVSQIKDLEVKSSIDPLTKVYNRSKMDEFLQSACQQSKSPKNLHLLMIDIDDFKHINDRFGHLAGDKVLIFLANIFKKTVRDGDKVFRFGGEEFVIFVNRTDTDGAVMAAERIMEIVRKSKLLFKEQQMGVTLSIGIAHYQEGDDAESILLHADQALYRAKNMGKDQLQVWNQGQ
ncbi:MAG: GGDEF domain-containing protein [Campylobacterales bacterium]|nr:GGDEF domain-containing protein [Campylobacterales bacterium]